MNSNDDSAKQKRPLGDDDDGDSSSNGAGRCGVSSSNGAGRCGGPGGERSSHGISRGGKHSRIGHDNFGNNQPATNDGNKSLQETIQKQLQEQISRFSFETLLTANAENFKVENATSLFSHAKDNHFGAQTVFDTKFQQSGPDRAIVGAMIRPSALVQKFRNRDGRKWIPKAYGSKADICSFILAAVEDSIFLAEQAGIVTANKVFPRLERSLFGYRPDSVVIRDEDGIGLVAIVVKQPVEEAERTLIDYENVVGHAYDQAQAMTAFGQGTSTVVISSLKESYLCSLEPDGLCSAEHLQDGVVETETANQAAKNINGAETKRSAMRCTDTSPGVSGSRDISCSLYIGSGAGGDSSSSIPDRKTGSTFLAEQNRKQDRKQDRKLYSTASHRPHDLVRMLYDAIKIAKSKYKKCTTEIFKLDANKSYEFPKALCVVAGEKEKYCWGKLQATLGYQIVSRKHQSLKPRAAKQETIDSNDKQSFYIIGSLGQGSTSNVFQALTWDGEHVAIKVYVKRYGDHYESLDDSAFQTVATTAVEREKDHLLLFYPELF